MVRVLLLVMVLLASVVGITGGFLVGSVAGADESPQRMDPRPLGATDGSLTHAVSVFDDTQPGVVKLDPDLLAAVRAAATEASSHGIVLWMNSGWRSPAYQDELLSEAAARYGSEEEASRWVATAQTSAHVTGDAIDIGDLDATEWLSSHGAAYGLCQIYENEPWHYELRTEAVAQGCPSMFRDPTADPRMQP